MKSVKIKSRYGLLNLLKYELSWKPLLKIAVDLNINAEATMVKLGIADKLPFLVSDMTSGQLNKLCNYFGVHPNELFTFVEKKKLP